jgi:hypothetical protein
LPKGERMKAEPSTRMAKAAIGVISAFTVGAILLTVLSPGVDTSGPIAIVGVGAGSTVSGRLPVGAET